MPAIASRQRLAQVAFWYYIEGMTQNEIAERIGLSRSNVSRMLLAAREQDIVRFEITFPLERDVDSERALASRFSGSALREIIVAAGDRPSSPSGNGGASRQGALLAVAQAGVQWLETSLRDGMTVGLTWGSTIQALVDAAHFDVRRSVHVVQLAGDASIDPRHSAQDLVRDLANRIGGTYTYFAAPAAGRTARDSAALLRSPHVSAAIAAARSADVAILGVGAYNVGSSRVFLTQAAVTPSELAEAESKHVVGQVVGRLFDSAGSQPDLAIHRRLISIDINDLKKIPTNVMLAAGAEKAAALEAAIVGGLVHVMIIDSALAQRLMIQSSLPIGRLHE